MPRSIVVAGLLIGAFYLIATVGMQVILPADQISETSGLMDALTTTLGDGPLVTVLGVGILYAFFAALIPWTIGPTARPRRPPIVVTCPRCSAG